MKHVLEQAARYGAQCALLERQKLETDRANVRKAYWAFRDSAGEDEVLKLQITNAFWDAHDKA